MNSFLVLGVGACTATLTDLVWLGSPLGYCSLLATGRTVIGCGFVRRCSRVLVISAMVGHGEGPTATPGIVLLSSDVARATGMLTATTPMVCLSESRFRGGDDGSLEDELLNSN